MHCLKIHLNFKTKYSEFLNFGLHNYECSPQPPTSRYLLSLAIQVHLPHNGKKCVLRRYEYADHLGVISLQC